MPVTMARRKPKTIPVYVRMQVRLREAMLGLAEEHRRDFSEEVAIALEEYLAKHDRWPPTKSDGNDGRD